MNQSDEKKFADIMSTIGEVFSKPLSNIQMDIYFDCLKEFSIDEVSFAAKYIIRNRTITGTFPLVAEFVQAIENKEGTPDQKAELAWTVLIWTIERVGHMQSIQFEDQKIHDVVQAMGGWLRVCSADNDVYNEDWHTKNLQWRRKDFISLYKAMSGSNLPYLPGLQEIENSGKYDDYVPKIMRVIGRPGQYQALPGPRPREITEQKIYQLEN